MAANTLNPKDLRKKITMLEGELKAVEAHCGRLEKERDKAEHDLAAAREALGEWESVGKVAYAELVAYHIKTPLPQPIKGYVCEGRLTLERLGILLGYIKPGHFTEIGTDY